jgi:hypothetical protein
MVTPRRSVNAFATILDGGKMDSKLAKWTGLLFLSAFMLRGWHAVTFA